MQENKENNSTCIRCGVGSYCPHCSGVSIIKSGKTAAGKQPTGAFYVSRQINFKD